MSWFIKDGQNLFSNGSVIFKVGQTTEGVDSLFFTFPSTNNNLYEYGNVVDCDDERLFYVDTSAGVRVLNLSNLTLIATLSDASAITVRSDKAGGRIFVSNYSNVKVYDYNDFSLLSTLSLSNVSAIDYDAANNIIAFGNLIYNYTTLASISSISISSVRGIKFDLSSQIFISSGTGNGNLFQVYDYSYNLVATLTNAQMGGSGRYRSMFIKDGYLGVQCSFSIRFLPLNNVTAGYNSSMNIYVGQSYIHGACYDPIYNRIFYAYLRTSPTPNTSLMYLYKLY